MNYPLPLFCTASYMYNKLCRVVGMRLYMYMYFKYTPKYMHTHHICTTPMYTYIVHVILEM